MDDIGYFLAAAIDSDSQFQVLLEQRLKNPPDVFEVPLLSSPVWNLEILCFYPIEQTFDQIVIIIVFVMMMIVVVVVVAVAVVVGGGGGGGAGCCLS